MTRGYGQQHHHHRNHHHTMAKYTGSKTASKMYLEKKKQARNEASRALKKYAKKVRKEGLESDRVKVNSDSGDGSDKDVKSGNDYIQVKEEKEEMLRGRNGYNEEGYIHTKDKSRRIQGKGSKQKGKHNPFAKQQQEARAKAELRAQKQEERAQTQAIIKEKERIRDIKRKKFLRQKKPHIGGQIGRLLEKIKQSS